MKRALCLALVCAACDSGNAIAPPPSRVEAIAAKPSVGDSAGLCDAVKGESPTFTFPEVEGSVPAARGPRWINIWATWCPPCVEELPVIRRLEAELIKRGTPVALSLLSVDTTSEAVEKFQAKHPEVAGTLRLKDEKALESWVTSIGLDKNAALPVHVFVRPDGKVACTRMGSLHDGDLPAIAALLYP